MSVQEKLVDFKCVEQEIFEYVCGMGRALVRRALELYDVTLRERRDKHRYRHKGTKNTTVKTIMGEVEYRRAAYLDRHTDKSDADQTRHVFLLDEALGGRGPGLMSGLLTEIIAKACCDGPYRAAARSVSELTGQRISHTAAWNVVQSLGAAVDNEEKRAADRAANSKGTGELVAKLLFEEQDGIWLHLQGKSRIENGKSKEMKLAIAYDGAKETSENRYILENKVACANFETAGEFVRRKEGVIAGTYNVDEIDMRILGGDGASWIRNSQTDQNVHFQLDFFHQRKALNQHVSDPIAFRTIHHLLYTNQIDSLLTAIEAYKNSSLDKNQKQEYQKLLDYYRNNKDGLIAYKGRGLDLPNPPEGKVYRNLGAMESNIFTILGNRMKGGRACWSIDGGNNLARLLCLKFTDKLGGVLGKLTSRLFPERYAQEVSADTPPVLSAAKVPFRVGKGYSGFTQAEIPPSLKMLKELFAPQPIHEMRLPLSMGDVEIF